MNTELIGKALRTAIRGLALVLAMFGVNVDDGAAIQSVDAVVAGIAALMWLVPEIIGWIKAVKKSNDDDGGPITLKPA